MEAHKANTMNNGELVDVCSSWSCYAMLQITQLRIPAPPCDSGMCSRSQLIFDDLWSLWSVGTRAALCGWCICWTDTFSLF